MSSRILRRGEASQAAPVNWNLISNGEGEAETHLFEAAGATAQQAEPAPAPPAPPPGPPLEDYLRLEKSLRTVEQSIPERERRAQQKGREEGEAAATAKWQAAMESATRSVAALGSLRSRIRREAEQDVIRLATAMARRVLRRELSVDPEAICGLLRTAFERLDMRETSRIRVRPEDRETVAAYLGRIGSPQRIEVIPDPSLERGALLLDCDRGQLDASAETQLEEIERGFADLLERRKEH